VNLQDARCNNKVVFRGLNISGDAPPFPVYVLTKRNGITLCLCWATTGYSEITTKLYVGET